MRSTELISFPETGKINNAFFKELVFPYCGAQRSEVIIGPQMGVDVSVVQLPNGLAMAMTSDPLSLIPTLGLRESAWLSVQLMANDMATTGFAPQYAQLTLNLPQSLSAEDFNTYWKYIHEFCEKLGVAITGGHTGRFEGLNSTVAGGGTMITIAPAEDILTSKGAQPGDLVVMTKECALVATSILAMSFPETVLRFCGETIHQQAVSLFYETSAVEAGLVAGELGRQTKAITAMHDVTEGGVLGASCELALASDCGILINTGNIPVGKPQREIGKLFSIDPMCCIGAGSMLITVKPDYADLLISTLQQHSISSATIGVITKKESGFQIQKRSETVPLVLPKTDPYWEAFFNAFRNEWK
ncbi:MAG TPA: AIR synthase family protein [Ohtaekwangia sp.]